MPETSENLSKETFAEITDVSRETLEQLSLYVDLLIKWQRRINLVGAATLKDVWRRHMLDSAQLYPHVLNQSGSLLDVGSGAGFPGLALSIMGIPNVTLVESNQKKCSFLGEVIRQTSCTAQVFHGRVEDYPDKNRAETITARALAPLEELLGLSFPLLAMGGKCLFLKGQTFDQELTQSEKKWIMEVQIHPSIVDNSKNQDEKSSGVLLEIGKLSPRDG
jgi:16S rRNA (guanine527-N7)-methyltransferase